MFVPHSPKILAIYAAYFIAIFACISVHSWQLRVAHLAMWLYTQATPLHRFRLDAWILRWIRYLRVHPVCVWVKTDDVSLGLQTLADASVFA